ncbi:MAG: hypothetical protein MZV63_35880 [Marinilabiliales bacterium]|nr:hypothetical protein [Marinilabiliales bacterium]
MGTYRYQGQWEVIDQLLVSPSMAEGSGPFQARHGVDKGPGCAFPFH